VGLKTLAFVWGLAESTLFFLVPDIPISFAALDETRKGLLASLLAVGGAVLGGALMYTWGGTDQGTAAATLERVPAIDLAMIEQVERDLQSRGVLAMVAGSFSGVPYKIYAVKASGTGIPLWPFLLMTLPARLLRFALVSVVVGGISTRWLKAWPRRRKLLALAAFWILFYTAFFLVMP